MDEVGIASVNNEIFDNVPYDDHNPKNILEGAKSIIVFGKSMPRSHFKANYFKPQMLQRAYHSLYKLLDISGVRLARFMESNGFYGVSIPSYNPLSMKGFEPWGIISLKHAGYAAGLGIIAKNGLLIHPKHGTLLRLSSVITTAELISDKMIDENICLECNLCIENCSGQAFDEKNNFLKFKCLPRTVQTGVAKIGAHLGEDYYKNIELFTNTLLLEYSVGCEDCLRVCPLNKTPLE